MFGKYKSLFGEKPRFKSSYDAVIIGGGLHGLAGASVDPAEIPRLCAPISAPRKMYHFTEKRLSYGRC
jgi:hypothetical protein